MHILFLWERKECEYQPKYLGIQRKKEVILADYNFSEELAASSKLILSSGPRKAPPLPRIS